MGKIMREGDFQYTEKLAEAMDAVWKYSPSDEALQKAKEELAHAAANVFHISLCKEASMLGEESKGIVDSIKDMLIALKEPKEKIFRPMYISFQDTWKFISAFVHADKKEGVRKKDLIIKKCKVLLEKVKLEAKRVAIKIVKMAAMSGLSVGLTLTTIVESLQLGVKNGISATDQAVTHMKNKMGEGRQ